MSGASSASGCAVFVALEALVRFAQGPMPRTVLAELPGNPRYRQVELDGVLYHVTAYPYASFFLETLKGMVDEILVFGAWGVRDILDAVGLPEVATISYGASLGGSNGLPGARTLQHLGKPVNYYSRSLIVDVTAAPWHPLVKDSIVLCGGLVSDVGHTTTTSMDMSVGVGSAYVAREGPFGQARQVSPLLCALATVLDVDAVYRASGQRETAATCLHHLRRSILSDVRVAIASRRDAHSVAALVVSIGGIIVSRDPQLVVATTSDELKTTFGLEAYRTLWARASWATQQTEGGVSVEVGEEGEDARAEGEGAEASPNEEGEESVAVTVDRLTNDGTHVVPPHYLYSCAAAAKPLPQRLFGRGKKQEIPAAVQEFWLLCSLLAPLGATPVDLADVVSTAEALGVTVPSTKEERSLHFVEANKIKEGGETAAGRLVLGAGGKTVRRLAPAETRGGLHLGVLSGDVQNAEDPGDRVGAVAVDEPQGPRHLRTMGTQTTKEAFDPSKPKVHLAEAQMSDFDSEDDGVDVSSEFSRKVARAAADAGVDAPADVERDALPEKRTRKEQPTAPPAATPAAAPGAAVPASSTVPSLSAAPSAASPRATQQSAVPPLAPVAAATSLAQAPALQPAAATAATAFTAFAFTPQELRVCTAIGMNMDVAQFPSNFDSMHSFAQDTLSKQHPSEARILLEMLNRYFRDVLQPMRQQQASASQLGASPPTTNSGTYRRPGSGRF